MARIGRPGMSDELRAESRGERLRRADGAC